MACCRVPGCGKPMIQPMDLSHPACLVHGPFPLDYRAAMADARSREIEDVAARVARDGTVERIPTMPDPVALALGALYRLHDRLEEALVKFWGEAPATVADTLWPIHDQLERDIIAVKAALGPARLAAIEAAMQEEE